MKETLMVVLGGGGHTEQLLYLSEKLEKKFDIEYVVKKDARRGKRKIKGRIFKIINPRPMDNSNLLASLFRLIPCTIQSLKILKKSKAKTIINCGPAISVPISFLGKFLFRRKIIFIESWSRVKSQSLSGKLISRFSNLIFVQWRENKKYKKAIYAGRLG